MSGARTRSVLVVDDPLFDQHAPQGYHPERPERLGAARRALQRVEASGTTAIRLAPRDASREELERAHAPAYLDELERLDGHRAALDADTYLAPASVRAARRGAGGAMALVEALVSSSTEDGTTTVGAALLRPPGHHATRAEAMGFCLLNHAAIAALHALSLGLSRVAIVDWDVHHGNGTQDIFWRDPRVLYVSLHQSPLYPGTGHARDVGEGEGRGFTVNVPLGEGARPAVYEEAFARVVLPVLELQAPELVIVSAGFDAHARDPLASMQLDDAVYGRMAASLATIAMKSAKGRVALLLEGGYDLAAIEGALEASVQGALDPASARGAPAEPLSRTSPDHAAEIAAAEAATRASSAIG